MEPSARLAQIVDRRRRGRIPVFVARFSRSGAPLWGSRQTAIPPDGTVLREEELVSVWDGPNRSEEGTTLQLKGTFLRRGALLLRPYVMFLPGQETVHFREGPLHRLDETFLNLEATLHRAEATFHPSEATLLPFYGTFLPIDGTLHPIDGTLHPMEATLLKNMGSPHRREATFLRIEATLLPFYATFLPIHGTLHPLEATLHPTDGVTP